jgi:hypothetical protein
MDKVLFSERKRLEIIAESDIKEAIDRAIESAPGAVALSDATIERGFWYIPYVYGEGWIAVEGNPVFE